MSHLIIFAVDKMSCAHCQIQLCIYERKYGTLFDESKWPVKDKYKDHYQSLENYYKGQSHSQMDGIKCIFLKRAQ